MGNRRLNMTRCTAMSYGTSTEVCRNSQSRGCSSNADVPPSRGQLLVQLAEASRHFVWLSSPLASRGLQAASRLRNGVVLPLLGLVQSDANATGDHTLVKPRVGRSLVGRRHQKGQV